MSCDGARMGEVAGWGDNCPSILESASIPQGGHMTELHDPLNFLSQMRQILAADKLPLAFFLGAGCPASIRVVNESDGSVNSLIPDISGVTKMVEEMMLEDNDLSDGFKRLKETFSEDGRASPTVEDILNRVRAFHDVAGAAGVRGIDAPTLKALDRKICAVIRAVVDKSLPAKDTPYHHLADFIRLRRQRAPEIFTTNYDLLCEEALEDRRATYFDGFVGAVRPFFDQQAIEEGECPPRWAKLWKLHGSINWRIEPESNRVFRSDNESDGDELLIHPSRLKYDESRRMPYVVMIDRLRGFLRRPGPAALIIAGYSFGDEHINAAIVDGLQANPSAVCFGLQYGNIDRYPAAIALAKRHRGLALFGADAAVFRGIERSWARHSAVDQGFLIGAFETVAQTIAGDDVEGGSGCGADVATQVRMILGDFAKLGVFLRQFIDLAKGPGDEA